jgi:tRNA(fMet)-specific endonuclease VapC
VKYLLDTSIVSEPVKKRPNPRVIERLREHGDECAIVAAVWHELLFGVLRLPQSRRRETLERYLDEVVRVSYPIMPYDEAAADWHARERARLERAGRPSPWVDGEIAAIAAVAGAVLVTANPRHFRWFRGVTVRDWTKGR